MTRLTSRMLPLAFAMASLPFAVASAAADCRTDLIAVDTTLKSSRAGVESAASAAAAVQCAAYRKHVAALTKVRDVFARCDTSKQRDANVAAVGTTLADFTARARAACGPPAKKK